jgi:nucleoside-diphosphate-sugar epimerase
VTGAAGFLGRHIVQAARAKGLPVLAVVRQQGLAEWRADPAITALAVDLADATAADRLAPHLTGVCAIIHAAGPVTSDPVRLARDGIAATVNLLAALEGVKAKAHFVLVSSLAIYDVRNVPQDAVLTEETPVLAGDETSYAQTKLAQESLVTKAADRLDLPVFILRPGILFGAGHLRNGHLGVKLGMLLIRIGADGRLPLCYVKNCAEAIVLASLKPIDQQSAKIETLNLMDSDLPTRKQYVNAIRKAGWPRLVLPMPWGFWQFLATSMAILPGTQSRIPGLMQPQAMRFRLMPMRYSNDRARARLGWEPRFGFDQAMADCTGKNQGPGR